MAAAIPSNGIILTEFEFTKIVQNSERRVSPRVSLIKILTQILDMKLENSGTILE